MTCEHWEFEARVDVHRMHDGNDSLEGFRADIRVQCKGCKLPFRFLGVPFCGVSQTQPSVNIDETELSCPIEPEQDKRLRTKARYEMPRRREQA